MSLPLSIVRIYNAMQEAGTATAKEIAVTAHASATYTSQVLRWLRDCGLCHIHSRKSRKNAGGTRLIVWKFGQGEDAPKEEVVRDFNASHRRRQARLIDQYGHETAIKILRSRANGGADRIVKDGKVIYQRGKRRGTNNA